MNAKLPNGIRRVAGGESTAEILLSATGPEIDPEREGIRVLLALAWAASPRMDLVEFVDRATLILPQLRCHNPAIVAEVARRVIGAE